MKYCPKCKKLYDNKNTHCTECKNKTLLPLKDGKTPVHLCNCNASQREILMVALNDAKIPCSYSNQSQPNGMALEGFNLFVPAGSYKASYEIAVETGILAADEGFFQELTELEQDVPEFEEMSPAKRATVRVLSAIAIIVVFALVIFGVDYIMALIKNLFM